MWFTIATLNDNGSSMKFLSKDDFLKELSMMIDNCNDNGGSFFDVEVNSNVSCFLMDEDNI